MTDFADKKIKDIEKKIKESEKIIAKHYKISNEYMEKSQKLFKKVFNKTYADQIVKLINFLNKDFDKKEDQLSFLWQTSFSYMVSCQSNYKENQGDDKLITSYDCATIQTSSYSDGTASSNLDECIKVKKIERKIGDEEYVEFKIKDKDKAFQLFLDSIEIIAEKRNKWNLE